MTRLESIGLEVQSPSELDALTAAVFPAAQPLGALGKRRVVRWEDPSGARLALSADGNRIASMMPSFAGRWTTMLAGVSVLAGDVCAADVVVDGEVATRLAIALEEGYLLGDRVAEGPGTLVALAHWIDAFPDADAFAAAPQSLLSPDSDPPAPRPATVPAGMPWPPRLGHESFISFGIFAGGSKPTARLAGTVLSYERRRNARTGQQFDLMHVRTAGFETDLCLPGYQGAVAPPVGSVVSGEVYMVGSLPAAAAGLAVAPPGSRLPWRRAR